MSCSSFVQVMSSVPNQPLGMRRPRYRGAVEDVTTVIVPFLAAKLNFLVYNDTYGTKINKKQIKQAWPVVAKLESLQENLAFNGTTFKAALAAALRASRFFKDMSPAEVADWTQTMSMRMKNITRHVQQTKIKKSKWLEDWRAPEDGGDAVSEADEDVSDASEGAESHVEDDSDEQVAEQPAAKASPAQKQTKDVTAYQFGFDYELWLPWRIKPPDKNKEYGEVFQKKGAEATDCMQAAFRDGLKREIAGLLVNDWEARASLATDSSDRRKNKKHHWYGTWGEKGVVVKPRADRRPLMTLLVDNKMACMVKSKLFKSPVDAFSFMVIIATTLCEGEVSKEGLYELRDQMLQDLKLDAAPLAVALKRPAAGVGGLQLLLAKKPSAAIAAAMPA